MRRDIKKLWLILISVAFLGTVYAGQEVFSTWDGLEADKLASIWLLERFISPGTTVVIYPKGELIRKGIQFDTPYSKIKRTYNRSTFESLIEHYHITDPKLVNIGRLIHDIEINLWEKKVFYKTREMEIIIMDLLHEFKRKEVIIERAKEYFDLMYKDLPENLKLNLR